MDRIEWLEKRRKVLGASDVAGVLGISKWSRPLDVWLSKMESVDTEETQSMRLGHRLQPAIAEEAAEMEGLTIHGTEVFEVAPHASWAGATIDYLARDAVDQLVILECKATWQSHWDEIPDYYQTQLAWQCWVHGVNRAKIAVLHASTKVAVYDFNLLEVDPAWFTGVVEYCDSWWHRHIVNRERPSGEVADLAKILPVAGKTVEFDEIDVQRLGWLKLAKAGVKEVEAEIKSVEDEIKAKLGDAEVAVFGGQPVATWKAVSTTRFDATKFKKDYPELHASYSESSTSRRFLIKEVKHAGSKQESGRGIASDQSGRVAIGEAVASEY